MKALENFMKDGIRNMDIVELKRCAKNGDANSQNDLAGYYFSQGEYKKSFFWLKKAVEQDFPFAMINLGKMYKDGIGTTKDIEVAIDLFVKSIGYGLVAPIDELNIEDIRKCASKGNANAQTLLGICYGDGINVKPDTYKSMHWYHKAAEQGHSMALFILGTHLYTGEKIPQNILSAEFYLSAALEQGVEKAKGLLSKIYVEIANEIPCYLVKITGKKWAEKFLDGEMFMRTLESFFKEGFENEYRGDLMEGFSLSFGNGHNPYCYMTDINGNIHEISGDYIIQDGLLDVLLQREKIFSLYCLDYDEIRGCFIQPDQRLRDFGDTVVIILEPQKFLQRVTDAIHKRFNDVDYWMSYKRVLYDIDLSINRVYDEFHKTSQYSYQREFRIALDLTQGRFDKETLQRVTDFARITFPGKIEEDNNIDSIADSLTLQLGNIRDICVSYSIDEFFEKVYENKLDLSPPKLFDTLEPKHMRRPTFFRPIGHLNVKIKKGEDS